MSYNKEYAREWYLANKAKVIAKTMKYQKQHAEHKKEYDKVYYLRNRESIRLKSKEWMSKHRERGLRTRKEYNKSHPERRASIKRKYYEAHKEDWIMRKHVQRVIKALELPKTHPSRIYLGCHPEFLRGWIEALFQPGMTWGNYGTVWNIDHIVPFSWWDVKNYPQHAYEVSHYSNLQPMFIHENLRKLDKYAS